MQLTAEQQEVLNTSGNVAINAVAGSGKTTTLVAYAKSRPANSRILYLAFNKTVKAEAVQKFSAAEVANVKVETAHSLAFDYVVKHSNYRVVQGYKSYEWCDMLGIKTGDRHTDFIIANHVNKFISFFCNSKAARVQELNYAGTLSDAKAAAFVKNFHSIIERFTREALAKMDKAEIAVTHDFYLKKFQLVAPVLPYEYILFDEGQDASAAMLDVFLQQPAIKLIVGDVHQRIYGWRYAVKSLQQVDFPVYNLSHSFRFDEEIALIANKILAWKKFLRQSPAVKIIGAGISSAIAATKATLGRTNLSLLLNAIAQWQHGQIKNLYFEGNINSYTFADEGASLYDVLNLYNGKKDKIKDKLIAEMKTMKELEDYIEKTEDSSLAMIVEVVKEFGNKLPSLINELKTNHTVSKEDADMIFSTVHRCKGMEYDEVTLLSDFINEEKLKRYITQYGGDKMNEADRNRLAEEINILYVAATRAKNKLIIPAEINPLRSIEMAQPQQTVINIGKNYQRSRYHDEPVSIGWQMHGSTAGNNNRSQLKYNFSKKPGNHGKRWTDDDENTLVELFGKGISIREIANELARGEKGIRQKLINMGLLNEEDVV